jgi:hypothetical protein
LRRPTDAHQDLFEVAGRLLERALRERHSPVRLLGVRVTGLTPTARQLELFDEGPMRMLRLNRALDRIAEKNGSPAVAPARFAPQSGERSAASDRRTAFDTADEREGRFSR